MPSELEIKNSERVLEMLSKMEDVSFEQKREDIFEVTEPESGLSVLVDVEETIVSFLMEIGQDDRSWPGAAPDVPIVSLYKKMLEINAEAVHGAFCLSGQKIIFKDNLEIEHLDQNELEASIQSMILTVYQNLKDISELIG